MTILFDIYPAISHLNASFALANKVLKEQHRIVYCAAESEHEKIIRDKGFESVMLDHPLASDKQELLNMEIREHANKRDQVEPRF